MAELRRVLGPGGRLTFIEHGLSPDTGVATWQRRMHPVQRRIVGGCRLTLPVLRVIEGAGFVVEQVENDHGCPGWTARLLRRLGLDVSGTVATSCATSSTSVGTDPEDPVRCAVAPDRRSS
jgi:hypothetical protein